MGRYIQAGMSAKVVLLGILGLANSLLVPQLEAMNDLLEASTQFEYPLERGPPTIDSTELQSLITAEALEKGAERLFEAANESFASYGHPTRAIGSAGHNATLEYIYDTLDDLSDYYDIETQPFVAIGGRLNGWNLSTSEGRLIDSRPLQMSPSADVRGVAVHFLLNFGCLPSDYDNSNGKIVVVKRGECVFGDKAEFAGLAGAVGVLLWDPTAKDSSEVFRGGDLGTPLGSQVATVGISGDTAALLQEGERLDLFVDSEILMTETVNIIAETKGGDHNNVVFLGSHSDSVPAGPGINDNGSGLITLLEVAKQLTRFEVKNAVRFAWWSAEELGLKGSLYYTENLPKREADKIRLFMDYDMLASPNYIFEVYDSDDSENPKGSGALRDMYTEWFSSHGHNWTLQPFDGRSDYVGFIEIGIPASGIDTGAEELKTSRQVDEFGGVSGEQYDHCYHEACDGLDNVNYDAWLVNSKLVAHSAAIYAASLDSFPKRDYSFFQQRNPERKWTNRAYI